MFCHNSFATTEENSVSNITDTSITEGYKSATNVYYWGIFYITEGLFPPIKIKILVVNQSLHRSIIFPKNQPIFFNLNKKYPPIEYRLHSHIHRTRKNHDNCGSNVYVGVEKWLLIGPTWVQMLGYDVVLFF